MKRNLLSWCCYFALSTAVLASCSKEEAPDPTIASIAVSDPDFQVLEDATIRGEVAGILSNKNPNDPQGAGNFTVFAPNNAAFARLGLNTASDLLTLQKPFLTSTLLYHVANGTLAGSSLQVGSTSASALGLVRRISKKGNDFYVNGSKILATDVQTANGTIHVIDKVLLATGANVVESAVALKNAQVFTTPELSFLVEAVQYCELDDDLVAAQGITVFAPTDKAFRELGILLRVPLNVPADIRKLPKATVTAVLLNHVLGGGAKFTPDLPENVTVSSLGNTPVQIGAFTNGTITVKGANNTTPANMVIPDVQATNGVVHVIDQVLLP